MRAKDVYSLPWKHVTDWSNLTASTESTTGKYMVGIIDINIFVENIYRDISCELNIPYRILKPILKSKNRSFYRLKRSTFRDGYVYGFKDARLILLKRTLIIPDTSKISKKVTYNKLANCIEMYNQLSDEEKIEFLQETGIL